MSVLLLLLGCTRTPALTQSSEAPAPLRRAPEGIPLPDTGDDVDTGTIPACSGAPVKFGTLIDTNGVSAPYTPAISWGKGQICEVTCDRGWMGVTPSSSPSCSDDLGWPAPVHKAIGGIALCWELTGTPTPSSGWSTTCTARHSDGTTTDLPVSW